jgi:restriction endonuclease Mrr
MHINHCHDCRGAVSAAVGVQDQQTYVIKRVDEDFFEES